MFFSKVCVRFVFLLVLCLTFVNLCSCQEHKTYKLCGRKLINVMDFVCREDIFEMLNKGVNNAENTAEKSENVENLSQSINNCKIKKIVELK